MTEKPSFEIDTDEFCWGFEICWICKNRKKCPLEWECSTLEDMDNDNTDNGDDQA